MIRKDSSAPRRSGKDSKSSAGPSAAMLRSIFQWGFLAAAAFLTRPVIQNLGGWSDVSDDYPQYPVEVRNRAAGIFRMAGHMLGERLLLFLLHHGLVVSVVDDDPQPFPRRRD